MFVRAILLLSAALLAVTDAFQLTRTTAPVFRSVLHESQQEEETTGDDTADDDIVGKVERFLSDKFPSFASLLSNNPDIWKNLREEKADPTKGFTIFAPNEAAFEQLGEKKLSQLEDPRNLEIAQKTAAYHVVALESVSAQQLRTEDWTGPKPQDGSPRPFTVGGIATLGGEVPVGRSKSGGFLGFGAKEDGDAVIGPDAKIVKSFAFGDDYCIVHEVDALISPQILWRYCDQLRIPGF